MQGTRDPFGLPEEIAGYALSPAIEIAWIEGGDHSFKPRARSYPSNPGRTERENLAEVVDLVARFAHRLAVP